MRVRLGSGDFVESTAVRLGSDEVSNAWHGSTRVHPTHGGGDITALYFAKPAANTLNGRLINWYEGAKGLWPAYAASYETKVRVMVPQVVGGSLSWKSLSAYSVVGNEIKVPVTDVTQEALELAIASGNVPFMIFYVSYKSVVVGKGAGGGVNFPLLWMKNAVTYTQSNVRLNVNNGVRTRNIPPKWSANMRIYDSQGALVVQSGASNSAASGIRVFSADGSQDVLAGCVVEGGDVSVQRAWSIGFNINGGEYGGGVFTMQGYSAWLQNNVAQMPYGDAALTYTRAE